MYNPASGRGSCEAGTSLLHPGAALPFISRGLLGELCAGLGLLRRSAFPDSTGRAWVGARELGGGEHKSPQGSARAWLWPRHCWCWPGQARGVVWWL